MFSTGAISFSAGTFPALARDIATFAGGRRLAGVGLLTAMAIAAEGAGLLLLVPLLNRLGIAAPTPAEPPVVGLETALALYVAVAVMAALVIQARNMAVSELRLAYANDLRGRLHAALTAMEWRAFAGLRASDLTHAMTSEVFRVAQALEFLLRVVGWMVELPVLLAVALALSPAMTAAALAMVAALMPLVRPLNRRARTLGKAAGEASRALHADLADDLAGMRVMRSHGLEAVCRARFLRQTVTFLDSQMAFQRATGLARVLTQGAAALLAAVAVAVGVRWLEVPLADMLVLVVAFGRLAMAVLRLQDGWRSVLHALPAHAVVGNLLESCRNAGEPAGEEEAPPFTREIRLAGLGYAWPGAVRPVLRGLDAVIPAGRMVALVGPSGAGKSTLADLILGLIAPTEGEILVDGRPLTGARRPAWRRRVGYVPQDSFLFHDTIRANLTMAEPAAGNAALWEALEQAAAADLVRALPEGLETVVGDRGSRLSGGERQRLALARALLRRPALLILDEATGALDAGNENRVLEALECLRRRMTLLVIAHRMSTVRRADHVIVLEDGRIVETGAWSEIAGRAPALLDRLGLDAFSPG